MTICSLTVFTNGRDVCSETGDLSGENINALAGDDTLLFRQSIINSTVNLSSGNDTVIVSISVNASTILMENGNDVLSIDEDVINSTINMGSGNDQLIIGNDVETGSMIDLGSGDNSLIIGSDILNNSAGSIAISSGARKDFIHIGANVNKSVGTGAITLDTNADNDTIIIEGDVNSLGTTSTVSMNTGTGNDFLQIFGDINTGAGNTTNISLGNQNDFFTINGSVTDTGGTTLLSGDGGNDNIIVKTNVSNSTLSGGAGNDRLAIEGNSTNATLFGGDGNDILQGGTGSDTFLFDASTDVPGSVTITPPEVIKFAFITLIFQGRVIDTTDTDLIINFEAGTDTIELRNYDQNQVQFQQSNSDVVISLNNQGDEIVVIGANVTDVMNDTIFT